MAKRSPFLNTGQIRFATLKGDVALQSGERPVIIIQNQIGCVHSPRIWVIPLTSKVSKAKHLPMHIMIPRSEKNGLRHDSVALVEQAAFVTRESIGDAIGCLEEEYLWRCGNAWIRNCDMFAPEVVETMAKITAA